MDIGHARAYVLALMVFIQNIHVLNCRSEKKSIFKINFKQNKFILFTIVISILLQIIVMEVPQFSQFLQTYSVPALHMFILLCVSIPILFVMESYKQFKNSRE